MVFLKNIEQKYEKKYTFLADNVKLTIPALLRSVNNNIVTGTCLENIFLGSRGKNEKIFYDILGLQVRLLLYFRIISCRKLIMVIEGEII